MLQWLFIWLDKPNRLWLLFTVLQLPRTSLHRNSIVDVPWWDDLVTGLPKPLVQNGYITVPDKPGLGIDDIRG